METPKMRKLLAVAAATVFVFLAGCGGSGSHAPQGNKYLKACYADADRTVFVDIELPEGYYGLLLETTSPTLGQIAVESATYNLGVFEPGEYTFELELILRDDSTKDGLLDGVVESCTLVVEPDVPEPDVIEPPEPPEPTPCPPTVVVNINDEGGVLFRIDGCWVECEPVFELTFGGEIFEFVGNDPFLLPLDLKPGAYDFEVKLVDGCGNTSLVSGKIVITGPQDPGPQPPDGLLPPAWGLHKILVCKDGRNRLMPYPAACNLISQGKATLGACGGEK
jgi:hypothetical protein